MTDVSSFPLSLSKEEILNKYGTVKMRPESYYKFAFTFKGMAPDGVEIFAVIDPTVDDLYGISIDFTSVQMLGVLHKEFSFDSIDAYPPEN